MYSQLLVAALAASVSANIVVPGHHPMRRELQNFARQTDSAAAPTGTSSGGDDDDSCELALMSLASSLPTPDAALASYEATYTPTDSCSYSVPSSLSSDFVSYTSAVESWYSASSDAISSIVSQCPEYAGEASEISECPTSTGAAGSAASASASATTTSTGTADHSSHSASAKSSGSTSSSSATGTAAGSSASASASGSGASGREIGIVGAVLAGVLGVAVAL
ncbi:hypothetical protein VP1G_08836 [Cytospora mali]|uniref:Infection structure specific protein n=1 Tax=Cytospora mali TaxID=578113 RepID=A0A194VCM0_CYTMA|nr:hypothetical protein VP1G_08836 [Valsa mali var. pyri (nom. inval.)]